MKSAVRLADTGGAHQRTLETATANQLAANMDEQQLHRDREGPKWGYAAQDDLEVGFTMLTSGPKIGACDQDIEIRARSMGGRGR